MVRMCEERMTDIDFQKLSATFPADRISWRVGSTNKDKTKGLALAYIDARDVQDRLDEVCGPQNWQNRFSHADSKTICEIGIRVDGEWIWKANGAGDTDFEAEKGAISSSFKRAAVMWGIGKYLYDLSNIWVEIEPLGKSYKIKDGERPKLMKALGHSAPAKKSPEPQEETAPTNTQETTDRRTKAANWCYGAIEALSKVKTLDELEAWRKKNAKIIVQAHEHAPNAQAKLISAIEKRRDDLHPLSA